MPFPLLASLLLIAPSPSCPKTSKHAAPTSSPRRHPIPYPPKYGFKTARQGLDADISCVQAPIVPRAVQPSPPDTAAAADARMLTDARLRLSQVSGGQVPYNAMAGGSVGPGGSGKTQTHRSVMGEPFVTGAERVSTVGADKMVLEVRQTKTNMLDLQRAETTSLLERAVHTAAANKPAATQTSIDRLVATDASRAQVGGAAACPVLANH